MINKKLSILDNFEVNFERNYVLSELVVEENFYSDISTAE